jgi:hypothetical protein
MSTPIAPASPQKPTLDDSYDDLLASVRRRFKAVTEGQSGRAHLFTTSAPDLYELFLEALPPALRQVNTCHACRRFFQLYGSVVHVSSKGKTASALWDAEGTPEPYIGAISALAKAVSQAPIAGVFLSTSTTWGSPVTGEWHHLAVTPAKALVFEPSLIKTTKQEIAEKGQDYEMLLRGLAEFPLEVVRKAHSLLTTGALYRSEKCVGTAKFLVELHEQRRGAKSSFARDSLTWLAVAGAPAGFCHVRSTMISTLLEDLTAGLPFEQIKAKFDAKMDALNYQRPAAAPAAGNIARAEKIIAKLKTEGSLDRRFARLDEIQKLWVPASAGSDGEKRGVFSHIKPKEKHAPAVAEVDVPPVVMTWEKFARTVLPGAEGIEYFVPEANRAYMAMVTAKNLEAPPILQWDSVEKRNPVSCYTYHGGSTPAHWNLTPNVYHPVVAVSFQPSMWDEKRSFSHQGEMVLFFLEGAKDTKYARGAGFFPEFLKSEYHEIRATIEAHAKNAVIEGKDRAEACGIGLHKSGSWGSTFRVTSKGGVRLVYKLDRWD